MTRVRFIDQSGVIGGAELSLRDLAQHHRHESDVLLFGDGPFRAMLAQAGVTVTVEPAPASVADVRKAGSLRQLGVAPALLLFARRVARHCRGYDLIYANTQKAFIVGALAGRLAGVPVVWHLRDLMTAQHFGGMNRRLAVFLANHFAARVIANSSATAEALRVCGGREKLIQVVPNGIDPEPFDSVTPAKASRARTALNIGHSPVVGVFGRLTRWKGQDVLIRALVKLPKVHAIIVGQAMFGEEDQAYSNHLRELAVDLCVADRVHFLDFRDDIPTLMKAVDVVVHTSTSAEPFGRVIVEGMLAERPVVASAAGGALEIIEDQKTGWLVEPGDPDQLAELLSRLLTHPTATQQMATAGCQMARQRFALTGVLKQIDRIIEDAAWLNRGNAMHKANAQ